MADDKFSEIYRLYRQPMFRAAAEIVKNAQDAEDCVQDAFVKIFGHISDISEADSPRTRAFVIVVTRNTCFSFLRTKKHESGADIEELDLDSGSSVEEQAFSGLGVEVIERGLRELPDKYRDVLYLTAFEGYDLHGAAELLGITYENAKSRIRRARKKLADILNRGE